MIPKRYPTLLTIAGSDSIGGAGIQADIKTASSLGVYSMSAVTAITAQNTTAVYHSQYVSPESLKAQLDAILKDVYPDAVKIGMIPSVEAVTIIADFIKLHNLQNIVLDPVFISSSGHYLTEKDVPTALAKDLFPVVSLITPNIPEAEYFLQNKISSDETRQAAVSLAQKWHCKGVLLKGGHLDDQTSSTDLLYYDHEFYKYSISRIESRNTHGTGCALSSAIASYLALGLKLPDAVEKAKTWLTNALVKGREYEFGHGHGPLNFFK